MEISLGLTGLTLSHFIFFLFKTFFIFLFLKIYLFIHERHREKERQRHRQREKQAPHGKLDAGLDPRSPGSRPGPKAALNH